jgi:hypothetical protein
MMFTRSTTLEARAPAMRRASANGLGLLALTGAVLAAAQAQSPEAAGLWAQHAAACLSGARAVDGAVWTFAGHCAACWTAVGLSAVGALALIAARRP